MTSNIILDGEIMNASPLISALGEEFLLSLFVFSVLLGILASVKRQEKEENKQTNKQTTIWKGGHEPVFSHRQHNYLSIKSKRIYKKPLEKIRKLKSNKHLPYAPGIPLPDIIPREKWKHVSIKNVTHKSSEKLYL